MAESLFDIQAEFCRVMGHPARMKILHVLREKTLNVSDVIQQTRLTPSVVSRQLHILRLAGIVNFQRNGTEMIYQLADARIADICDLIYSVLSDYSKARLLLVRDESG